MQRFFVFLVNFSLFSAFLEASLLQVWRVDPARAPLQKNDAPTMRQKT